MTPLLFMACHRGRLGVVKTLLQRGADADAIFVSNDNNDNDTSSSSSLLLIATEMNH